MHDTSEEQLIPEADVRRVVRLLGEVAHENGTTAEKKRRLMRGRAALVGAAAWSWIVSRASTDHDTPAVVAFMHDGLTPAEFARYAAMMQDRRHTPVEY